MIPRHVLLPMAVVGLIHILIYCIYEIKKSTETRVTNESCNPKSKDVFLKTLTREVWDSLIKTEKSIATEQFYRDTAKPTTDGLNATDLQYIDKLMKDKEELIAEGNEKIRQYGFGTYKVIMKYFGEPEILKEYQAILPCFSTRQRQACIDKDEFSTFAGYVETYVKKIRDWKILNIYMGALKKAESCMTYMETSPLTRYVVTTVSDIIVSMDIIEPKVITATLEETKILIVGFAIYIGIVIVSINEKKSIAALIGIVFVTFLFTCEAKLHGLSLGIGAMFAYFM